MIQASEEIAKQFAGIYPDYNKLKTLVDLGYFLENYVVSGGVVTKDVYCNNIVNVTEVVVSLDNDVTRSPSTSFKTKIANTIYYLDYKSGNFTWGTSHPSGSYLTLAEVTTDGYRNVLSIKDQRGTVGGVRFKYDVSYGSISLSQLQTELNKSVDRNKTSSIYARAIEDISSVPSGSLDHAKNAITTTKALRVAFWGDSITEGNDIDTPDDGYVAHVFDSLKTVLPGITVTPFNFGVGGAGIYSAYDPNFVGGSGIFTQPWAVPGKSWFNHVKDFKPDLVVIAFGMNDGHAGEDNTYNSLVDLVNGMKAWNPAPSVVVVPCMLPVKDPNKFFGINNQYTLRVARVTREFGKANGLVVADANRTFQILRDGVDDVSRIGTKEINFTGYPLGWTGNTSDFFLNGTSLLVAPGLTGKFVTRTRSFYNGVIEFDVNIPGSGLQNAAWINYRDDSGNTGTITIQIAAGSGSSGVVALYTSDSPSSLVNAQNLTIPTGVNHHIRMEVSNTSHRIYVNGTQVINFTMFKKMNNGNITIGGSGLVPTYSNMNIVYEDPVSGIPFYTEDDILGKYNSPESGNGVNHPSALGHSLVYVPVFYGMIREISRTLDSGQFLPERIPSGWAAPGVGYPTTTTAGETLYYKFSPTYDKYKGIALRRLDNGLYYGLSSVAVSDQTIAQLEPGKFAYYASGAQDFMWISVPGGGSVTWDCDLYKYR